MGAALLAAVVLVPHPAAARPAHLRTLTEQYDRFLPGKLRQCGSCHVGASPAPSSDGTNKLPHNPFGAALASRRRPGTPDQPTDLISRLRSLASEDSDRDGVPNEAELLLGTGPGDPTSQPTRIQQRELPALQSAYRKFESQYRWRPFQTIPTVTPPPLRGWGRNPVDAFVAEEQRRHRLIPRPEASPLTLLRRVSLDLTGLAPTPAEQEAYLADRSPDRYEKLVDRLLASERHGERWARHWMDVWRYSDWAGFGQQVRDSQPHIWRWRDWIVRSLNTNKGYDRMVHEMLAGDELAPGDPEALAGTGFLVRNYKLLSREKWLEDTLAHTGQAFMGLTVGCARCHDHMYDPISQEEYYRLRAVFEPHQVRTDWVPGEADRSKDGLPRAYDANPGVATYFFVRGDERQPLKDRPLTPGVPESLGGMWNVRPVRLTWRERHPERQPHVREAALQIARQKVDAVAGKVGATESTDSSRAELAEAVAGLRALEAVLRVESVEDRVMDAGGDFRNLAEWQDAARAAQLAQRQLALAQARLALESARAARPPKPLADLEKAVAQRDADLRSPSTTEFTPREKSDLPAESTGRRLALARWLTSTDHPLTARAAVNQVWQRHFGVGIVPTSGDLGRNGAPPTHPQLLDWLSRRFISNGWNLKDLHRLIVTSSTYRQSATGNSHNASRDPDNRYLWRWPSPRLDAELVRDNLLWTAGTLDGKVGGPDLDPAQGQSVKRRSLYFRLAAEKEMTFLGIFDGPNVVECYARRPTVVPQQALALFNSQLAMEQAGLLAEHLLATTAGPWEFVEAAYPRVLSRPPSHAELVACLEFLKRPRKVPPVTGSKTDLRYANLILALFNHHDFVTVR